MYSQGYNPGVSQGYNPGLSQGYNPGVSQGYYSGSSAEGPCLGSGCSGAQPAQGKHYNYNFVFQITSSHSPVHCTENRIYVLPEKELRSPYIHVSLSDLYIPRIGPHIWLQPKRQTDPGNL